MTDEIVCHHGTTMVRRLRLAPGEAMPWHREPPLATSLWRTRDRKNNPLNFSSSLEGQP